MKAWLISAPVLKPEFVNGLSCPHHRDGLTWHIYSSAVAHRALIYTMQTIHILVVHIFILGGKSMNNIPDLILDGESKFNYFGANVACAGDLNNDGFSDIMVGAPGYETENHDKPGRIYIYYENSSPDTIPDVIISGKYYNSLGGRMASAGDVNNDGYDDIIVSVPNLGSMIDNQLRIYLLRW